MQTVKTRPEPETDNTLLGVCDRLSEDIGLPSFLFRIAFIGAFFWNWAFALVAYGAIAALVYGLRRWMPDAKPARELTVDAARIDAGNDIAATPETVAA